MTASRRGFLGTAALGLAAASLPRTSRAEEADTRRIVVAVMGLSRGRGLATQFAAEPGVVVKAVCDVDRDRLAACGQELVAAGRPEPLLVADCRRLLEDPEIDALVCAAPNHWHATATLQALAAGKHVYVEKPCCQVPREGERMVAAAAASGLCVQVGTQRRSSPSIIEAMRLLHAGEIGRVYAARAFYASARPSIGVGKPASVPERLDWELWQGPAPRRPYLDNRVHYNWHWFWHWGNGELGNNGVHTLDLCRWGLGVDFPVRVTSAGGRYRFADDQETPDTHEVAYEFADGKLITWTGHSCNRHDADDFITFYGEAGALRLGDEGAFTLFDAAGKERLTRPGNRGDVEHIANFLAAVRANSPATLQAGIADAYASTHLSLVGNIAHRTRRALVCDPHTGRIVGDDEAATLWDREYEPGWEPQA